MANVPIEHRTPSTAVVTWKVAIPRSCWSSPSGKHVSASLSSTKVSETNRNVKQLLKFMFACSLFKLFSKIDAITIVNGNNSCIYIICITSPKLHVYVCFSVVFLPSRHRSYCTIGILYNVFSFLGGIGQYSFSLPQQKWEKITQASLITASLLYRNIRFVSYSYLTNTLHV